MTGSTEIVNRTSPTGTGQEPCRWARLAEMVTKLSVIGILGLAGQQSVSGYQAVSAGQAGILDEPSPVVFSSAPIELVFAPNGEPTALTVITVADASGHTSTITVDAGGTVVID